LEDYFDFLQIFPLQLIDAEFIVYHPYDVVTVQRPVFLLLKFLYSLRVYPCVNLKVCGQFAHIELVVGNQKGVWRFMILVFECFDLHIGLKHQDHVLLTQVIQEQVGVHGHDSP
jgi:hypothetical protein